MRIASFGDLGLAALVAAAAAGSVRAAPSPGPAAVRATARLGRRVAEARIGAMQGGEREPSRQVMRAASRSLAKASGRRR